MVKQKIVAEKIQIEAYSITCEKCGKVIVGSKPQEVAFNMGLHIDSHKEKKQ
jgi:hypothetical protein